MDLTPNRSILQDKTNLISDKCYIKQSGKGSRNLVEKSPEVSSSVPSPPSKSLEKSVSKQTVSSDSCSFNSAVESKEIESDTDATATADYDSAGENEYVLAQDSTDQKENLNLTLLTDTLSALHIATPQTNAHSPHDCSLFSIKFTKTGNTPVEQVESSSEANPTNSRSDESDLENDDASLSGILNFSNVSNAEENTLSGITPFNLGFAELTFDNNLSENTSGHSNVLVEEINTEGTDPLGFPASVENLENKQEFGNRTVDFESSTAQTDCNKKQDTDDTCNLDGSLGDPAKPSLNESNEAVSSEEPHVLSIDHISTSQVIHDKQNDNLAAEKELLTTLETTDISAETSIETNVISKKPVNNSVEESVDHGDKILGPFESSAAKTECNNEDSNVETPRDNVTKFQHSNEAEFIGHENISGEDYEFLRNSTIEVINITGNSPRDFLSSVDNSENTQKSDAATIAVESSNAQTDCNKKEDFDDTSSLNKSIGNPENEKTNSSNVYSEAVPSEEPQNWTTLSNDEISSPQVVHGNKQHTLLEPVKGLLSTPERVDIPAEISVETNGILEKPVTKTLGKSVELCDKIFEPSGADQKVIESSTSTPSTPKFLNIHENSTLHFPKNDEVEFLPLNGTLHEEDNNSESELVNIRRVSGHANSSVEKIEITGSNLVGFSASGENVENKQIPSVNTKISEFPTTQTEIKVKQESDNISSFDKQPSLGNLANEETTSLNEFSEAAPSEEQKTLIDEKISTPQVILDNKQNDYFVAEKELLTTLGTTDICTESSIETNVTSKKPANNSVEKSLDHDGKILEPFESPAAKTECNNTDSIVEKPRDNVTKFQHSNETELIGHNNISKEDYEFLCKIHGHSNFTVEVINLSGITPRDFLASVDNFENTQKCGAGTIAVESSNAQKDFDKKEDSDDTSSLKKSLGDPENEKSPSNESNKTVPLEKPLNLTTSSIDKIYSPQVVHDNKQLNVLEPVDGLVTILEKVDISAENSVETTGIFEKPVTNSVEEPLDLGSKILESSESPIAKTESNIIKSTSDTPRKNEAQLQPSNETGLKGDDNIPEYLTSVENFEISQTSGVRTVAVVSPTAKTGFNKIEEPNSISNLNRRLSSENPANHKTAISNVSDVSLSSEEPLTSIDDKIFKLQPVHDDKQNNTLVEGKKLLTALETVDISTHRSIETNQLTDKTVTNSVVDSLDLGNKILRDSESPIEPSEPNAKVNETSTSLNEKISLGKPAIDKSSLNESSEAVPLEEPQTLISNQISTQIAIDRKQNDNLVPKEELTSLETANVPAGSSIDTSEPSEKPVSNSVEESLKLGCKILEQCESLNKSSVTDAKVTETSTGSHSTPKSPKTVILNEAACLTDAKVTETSTGSQSTPKSPKTVILNEAACLTEDSKKFEDLLAIKNHPSKAVKFAGLEPNTKCLFADLQIDLFASSEQKLVDDSNAVELNFDASFTEEANNVSREIALNSEEDISNNCPGMDNRLPSPTKAGSPKLNHAPIESNGLENLGFKMDLDKIIENQSESTDFIANGSEAIPVTEEEFSIPASAFDFDSLPCGERKSRLAGSCLTRNSLYVRFDPIVEKILAKTVDSPSPVHHLSQKAKSLQESCLERTPMKNPTLDEKLISLTPCRTVDAEDANSSVPAEIDSSSDLIFNKSLENANLNKTDADIAKCVRDLTLESDRRSSPSSSSSHSTKTPTCRNTPRGTVVVSQQNYVKELDKLQELMAKQKQAYQEELNRNTENMEKLQMEASQLKKEIQVKSKIISQSSVVLAEYERTISQLLAQNEEDKKNFEVVKEELIQERDTVTAHLNNTEFAFSDLFQKYERSKAVIEEMKTIQSSLKASNEEYDRMLVSQEEKYNKLKSHVTEQLEKARNEMDTTMRSNHTENEKVKANLKRTELKLKSVEDSLEKKTKEVTELTKILDELIGKVGGDGE